MYSISDEQIDFILNDIRRNGIELEGLQTNLLDHICCKVEHEYHEGEDFEQFYRRAIKDLCYNNLYEIQTETTNLLTFKNYYLMKKSMIISGIAASLLFISGGFFKIMHWPGASMLLVLAIFLLCFVFLPLMVLLKSREDKSTSLNLPLITGTITGILYSMAIIFTVMHWPGSSMLWMVTTAVSFFIFIPIYYFTGIKNPTNKLNTTIATVILICATGLLFTMIRLRQSPPVQMYSWMNNESILKSFQTKAAAGNINAAHDSLVTEMNSVAEKIKASIILNDIGAPSIPADYAQRNILISEHNIANTLQTPENAVLLMRLKMLVNQYNKLKNGSENTIPIAHSILDPYETNTDMFTNFSALNSLTQLQMCLAMADCHQTNTVVAQK